MSKKSARRKVEHGLACLFCGRRPLSAEHLWPDWMNEFFPKGIYRREQSAQRGIKAERDRQHDRTMQGGTWKTKIKAVCEVCNNGWMSVLESSVKEIILSLGRGNRITLNLEDQKRLARWVVMKIMTAEYRVPGLKDVRAFTPQICHALREREHDMPENFHCWIVRNASTERWGANYLRVSGALPPGIDMENDPLNSNSAAGMWGIGELLIVWFFTRRDDVGFYYQPMTLTGCQIWPGKFRQIHWPPVGHFSGQAKLAGAIEKGLWQAIDERERSARNRPELADSPDWMTDHSHPSDNQGFVLGERVLDIEDVLRAAQRIISERAPGR